LHAGIAGHRPSGPFKHNWGEHSRYVGDDRPFSLFLAAGEPFEVCDTLPPEGWTFLSDTDAAAQQSSGTERITRRTVPETLDGALKRRIKDRLTNVPHIEDDEPAVCSWLPTARRVLVWDLVPQRRTLTVR
jgi:hypothetical protein